jgi:predicted dehydrogenase
VSDAPATRIGYVGLDHHHCTPYLRSLAQLPVDVTAACEPTAAFDVDSVDELGDVPVYREPEALLDEADVDAIWVTLPNRATPAVAEAALARDIDVFTEKPAARTANELEPLLDAEAGSNATMCVSYPWRAHPIARDLRERADAGFFGDLQSFEARFFASAVDHRDADHYLFDRTASRGGILQWLGIHWLDLFQWLFDEPIVRVTTTAVEDDPAVDVEDGAAVLFETASGTVGSLQAGYYLGEDQYDTYVGAVGSEARCSWDPIGREFGFDGETTLDLERTDGSWDGAPHRTVTYDYSPAPGYGGEWGRRFIEQFLHARQDDSVAVPVGIADAHDVLRLLDAIYAAAGSDRWVSVERAAEARAEIDAQ